MARIWSTFTAPSGEKYYYNSTTKESTWKRPVSFDEDDKRWENKKARLARIPEPFYAIPLLNAWFLVIDDVGGKFYHNSDTGKSSWKLDDSESVELLASVDKNKLVLLIAIARGYNTSIGNRVYQEVIHDLEVYKEGNLKQEEEEESSSSAESEDEDDVLGTSGLVAGYSSSEEEENNDDNEIDALNNLEEDDLPKEGHDPESRIHEDFFKLFDKYQCDPYSTWSIQAKRLQDDPTFYRVANDSAREEIFEEWCEKAMEGQSFAQEQVDEECLDEDSSEEEVQDDLEPLPFHYLAHIVSKADIKPSTIFLDIKDQNKADFKKYKIKQFIKSRSAQESLVSKLLFYHKKLTLEERKKLFCEVLQSHSRSIKKSLEQNSELAQLALGEDLDLNDAQAVETRLLKMESLMGMSSDLQELANDPKYYILGIRDKTIEIMHFLTRQV